ncbi:MAG: glycosyltransferase [Candidatus Acidiferrales bacterium]
MILPTVWETDPFLKFDPMKICFLANAASIHIQRLAAYFAERGHQIHVVSLEPGSVPGATVHYVRWRPKVKQIGYLAALPRIRRAVARIRPDVLHAHYSISYGVLGALCGFRPLAIAAMGSDILVTPGKSWLRWAVLTCALKRADLITSAAGHISQVLMDHGIPREKIDTFPNGVDTQVFRPGPGLCREREMDIICTRNFNEIYNVELLLRALPKAVRRNPGLKCALAGDGPRQESLQAEAQQLGIGENLSWLGWLSSSELARWLQRSKVYVSPTLSDGTSTALTEAMACGCFPIALDIPANRPWIQNGKTGLLAFAATPECLADAILKALDQDVDLEAAAEANSETIRERADWYSIMQRLEEHYIRLSEMKNHNSLCSESRPYPREVI